MRCTLVFFFSSQMMHSAMHACVAERGRQRQLGPPVGACGRKAAHARSHGAASRPPGRLSSALQLRGLALPNMYFVAIFQRSRDTVREGVARWREAKAQFTTQGKG